MVAITFSVRHATAPATTPAISRSSTTSVAATEGRIVTRSGKHERREYRRRNVSERALDPGGHLVDPPEQVDEGEPEPVRRDPDEDDGEPDFERAADGKWGSARHSPNTSVSRPTRIPETAPVSRPRFRGARRRRPRWYRRQRPRRVGRSFIAGTRSARNTSGTANVSPPRVGDASADDDADHRRDLPDDPQRRGRAEVVSPPAPLRVPLELRDRERVRLIGEHVRESRPEPATVVREVRCDGGRVHHHPDVDHDRGADHDRERRVRSDQLDRGELRGPANTITDIPTASASPSPALTAAMPATSPKRDDPEQQRRHVSDAGPDVTVKGVAVEEVSVHGHSRGRRVRRTSPRGGRRVPASRWPCGTCRAASESRVRSGARPSSRRTNSAFLSRWCSRWPVASRKSPKNSWKRSNVGLGCASDRGVGQLRLVDSEIAKLVEEHGRGLPEVQDGVVVVGRDRAHLVELRELLVVEPAPLGRRRSPSVRPRSSATPEVRRAS